MKGIILGSGIAVVISSIGPIWAEETPSVGSIY